MCASYCINKISYLAQCFPPKNVQTEGYKIKLYAKYCMGGGGGYLLTALQMIKHDIKALGKSQNYQ